MVLKRAIWDMPVPLAGRWRWFWSAWPRSSGPYAGNDALMAGDNLALTRLMSWLTYVVLMLGAAVTLLPFLYLVSSALKTKEVFFSSHFFPLGDGFLGIDWQGLTLHHFYILFTDPSLGFGRAIVNSVFYASVSSILATLCAAMGGY